MTERLHFIGAGAAGGSLASAFTRAGFVVGVTERSPKPAARIRAALGIAPSAELSETIGDASIVFVAVKDGDIAATAASAAAFAMPHQTWFHLSGALSPAVLEPLRGTVRGTGAFHPAHVFAPDTLTALVPGIHFGVDGTPETLETAHRLARALGGTAVHIDASVRALYHATTVLASNAVVALVARARDLLASKGVPAAAAETLLVTLAESATRAAATLGLDNALSGPIQRGDAETVQRHLDALAELPAGQALYRTMSGQIATLARSAGRTSERQLMDILDILKTK